MPEIWVFTAASLQQTPKFQIFPDHGYAHMMDLAETSNLFTWDLPPTPPAGTDAMPKAVSFGLEEQPAAQTMPVWRIDFPADPDQAARLVQQAQEQAAAAPTPPE